MHSRTFLLIGLFLAGGFALACEGTLDGPTSPTSVDSSAPPSSINGPPAARFRPAAAGATVKRL